jgi:hypothetical protein
LHPIGPFGFTCTSGLLPTFGGALCANAEAEKQTVARTSNMRMVHFPFAFTPQLHKSPYKRTGEGAILLRLDAGGDLDELARRNLADRRLQRFQHDIDQRLLGEIIDLPLVLSPLPITTSWRAPLEPSMIVTVLCSPGAARFGAAPVSSTDDAVVVALSPSVGLGSGIMMLAIGSLPMGCLWKLATPTKATKDRPNKRASACIAVKDRRTRRFRAAVFSPSGALRSSRVSGIALSNQPLAG